MVEHKLRGHFICNNCRTICGSTCHNDLVKQLEGIVKPGDENYDDDFYPRKQIIECLGQYCDQPCELQKDESDLTIEQCIRLINYIGNKCHKLLEEKHK